MKKNSDLFYSRFCGCAALDDAINEIKGNLVGNGYTIRTYDNYGSKVMTTTVVLENGVQRL